MGKTSRKGDSRASNDSYEGSFQEGTARPYQHVPQAPTNPLARKPIHEFDVASLYQGPVAQIPDLSDGPRLPLDEKLRQGYFWIVNNAILSPHYDIEFNDGPSTNFKFGDSHTLVTLPSGQSYSSFVLMPLLNLAVRKHCLFVGGPGRGKTTSAVLMGVLAGYSVDQLRQAMQHGQPQMTVADLLGNPLPSDMASAQSMEDIKISWRDWLPMHVKIVDEYNRIPTRTQSSLLTLMADNYAEMLGHVYTCPPAAWYLTANDDLGGGTYPVIEALRDRIDIVVQALHFNPRFLTDLLSRIEDSISPERIVPSSLVFSGEELDQLYSEILNVPIPEGIRRRLEFFTSQFEYSEQSAERLEYQTKDTSRLSGVDTKSMAARETGKDHRKDLGYQTLNGFSVRSMMNAMVFAKAMAYFRGSLEVELEDLRQILPFVLATKLNPNLDSPFFEEAGHQRLRTDRVSWIRSLFDTSCGEYDRLDRDRLDALTPIEQELASGLEGVSEGQAKNQIIKIERYLGQLAQAGKLYGPIADDILRAKYIHQRYTNYLRWLKWNTSH